MTPLGDRLAAMIVATGSLSVADYMGHCLFDPKHGYYTTREPFGAAGDFVTAPEISQMFGELLGAWVRTAWEAIGSPARLTLAEIGPGRGTMMKDMLRALAKIDVRLFSALDVALVETSPRLRDVQRTTLGGCGKEITWHSTIDTLPARPLVIVGNELFDALPIRQYVKIAGSWLERVVTVDDAGRFGFGAAAGSVDASLLPAEAAEAPEGAVVEVAPARTALMQMIAARIAAHGGAGLFIDYGYAAPAVGDTLQAVRRHRSEGVLDNPGEADLTAHVDFSALGAEARAAGLDAKVVTQGEFLLRLGLVERAGRLGASQDEAQRQTIRMAVERLAAPGQMGELFKVLTVLLPGHSMRLDGPG